MEKITIYEVGPRDGLQGIKSVIPLEDKVTMVNLLYNAGLKNIEVGSFVHPKKVPNMANSDALYRKVSHLDCNLGVLVPNEKGLKRAISVGAKKFNVCLSPSETFNKDNFGISLEELFSQYRSMLYGIPKEDIRVYVSNAFGCPVEGKFDPEHLKRTLQSSAILGSTVVLSDTSGLANKESISQLSPLIKNMGTTWAIHLHHNEKSEPILDNVQHAYDLGIRQFDSSIGGLGGCPFAKDSGANLATEDLVTWAINNDIPIDPIKDLEQASSFVNKFKSNV